MRAVWTSLMPHRASRHPNRLPLLTSHFGSFPVRNVSVQTARAKVKGSDAVRPVRKPESTRGAKEEAPVANQPCTHDAPRETWQFKTTEKSGHELKVRTRKIQQTRESKKRRTGKDRNSQIQKPIRCAPVWGYKSRAKCYQGCVTEPPYRQHAISLGHPHRPHPHTPSRGI